MPAESTVLRIGEWRVDPNLDELSCAGQTIRLEPRAMRLLHYLAVNAGRVVDMQELLDEVWPNVVVTQGSVYQAIAQLRRILGDESLVPGSDERQAGTARRCGGHAEETPGRIRGCRAGRVRHDLRPMGEHGQGIGVADHAMRLRNSDLVYVKADSLLDPLRKEPRFQALERELKFPN